VNGSGDLGTGPLNLDDCNEADALIGMINQSRLHIRPIGPWSWSLQAAVGVPIHHCLAPREPRALSTGARKAETAFRIAATTSVGRQCDISFGSGDRARIRLPLVPHRERLASRNIHGESRLNPPHFPEDRTSNKQPCVVIVVSTDGSVAEAEDPRREAANVGCNDQRRRAC
jgi:hypothetical protein